MKWRSDIPIAILVAGTLGLAPGDQPVHTYSFSDPIDALSVTLLSEQSVAAVSVRTQDGWTKWEDLEVENEQDPRLRESNLVVFPEGVTQLRIRGSIGRADMHPVTVSREPVHYQVAALSSTITPKILSRRQWGADESLLLRTQNPRQEETKPEEKDSNGAPEPHVLSQRERDCEEAQLNYPQDFRTVKTVRTTGNGEQLRWARTYSPSVKLLVVHHTAMPVSNDARSGVERMRALYQYHAINRGWGDIGYHYVIDDEGQIYEGRSGGEHVVGGHAFCNNVGTISISLMGNFEKEQPTQVQMRNLQWLLDILAEQYDIDPGSQVTYHGKRIPTIVGHKDLLPTECPGYYVRETLGQIRTNVAQGDLGASIRFPALVRAKDSTDERRTQRLARRPVEKRDGLFPEGTTKVVGRPGGEVTVRLRYVAGSKSMQRGTPVADIARSHPQIGIWQQRDGNRVRLRSELLLPSLVRAGESVSVQILVQLPPDPGSFDLRIGDHTFTLQTEGRRIRRPTTPHPQTSRTVTRPSKVTRLSTKTSAASDAPTSDEQHRTSSNRTIRIRLGDRGPVHEQLTVQFGEATVNGQTINDSVSVQRAGEKCFVGQAGQKIAEGIVRITPKSGASTMTNWHTTTNQFRGTLECRVIDGQLVIINELPLEEYLFGLAEEPDTEPYEKQRAFAVAARTYAAYYLDATIKKFPGMPYDGSDSPAIFQAYGGLVFEKLNPRWVRAAKSTDGLVLTKNGETIRAPYFSTNDGRTRSPIEIGWKDFPFAEIFDSKPDPWCTGMKLFGHGVGMSGCGAGGQAREGKSAEDILEYYYPGTQLKEIR